MFVIIVKNICIMKINLFETDSFNQGKGSEKNIDFCVVPLLFDLCCRKPKSKIRSKARGHGALIEKPKYGTKPKLLNICSFREKIRGWSWIC